VFSQRYKAFSEREYLLQLMAYKSPVFKFVARTATGRRRRRRWRERSKSREREGGREGGRRDTRDGWRRK
jgi:hypothetical protein